MSNYNFEKNEHEFSETVRIDYINEEVRKQENFEDTMEVLSTKKSSANGDKRKEASLLPENMVKLSIIGGVIVCVFMFVIFSVFIFGDRDSAVREGNYDISEEVIKTDEMYAIILNIYSNESIEVYSINHKKSIKLSIDSDTVVYGENDQSVGILEFLQGDVITITEGDNQNVKEIRTPGDIWTKSNVTGAVIDLAGSTITYDGVTYSYGEDTYFVTEGASMYPGDMSEADTITIIGKNNTVFSVRVEKGHGILVFRSIKIVEDLEVLIDDNLIKIDTENGMADVGYGVHKLTIRGSNIEDYITVITVGKGDKQIVDLAEVIAKATSGVIYLNVDQTGYTVTVDGVPYTGSLTEIVTEKGLREIEIQKQGYEKWSKVVTVDDIAENLTVSLKPLPSNVAEEKKGSLIVYASSGARVYIDGKYMGIVPIMPILPYGEYYLEIEQEGVSIYGEYVVLDSPERTIKVDF